MDVHVDEMELVEAAQTSTTKTTVSSGTATKVAWTASGAAAGAASTACIEDTPASGDGDGAAGTSSSSGRPKPCAEAIKRAMEESEATRQLLASMNEPTPCDCKPFGITVDVDIEVGCNTAKIFESMREGETTFKRPTAHARNLAYRRVLVDWCCEAGDTFGIQKSTVHAGVRLMDRILQEVHVAKSRLQLVALCCLLIAAKYEEAEENVPSVTHLTDICSRSYSPASVHQMEIRVLDRLKWRITVVTPLHFLYYYLSKGLVFTSDRMQDAPLVNKVPRYVKKYIEFFADLCLQEFAFQLYLPSELAAAIVAASRRALSIRPLWNDELTKLVGYSQEDIADCFSKVWAFYIECFPSEASTADAVHAQYAQSPDGVTQI